MKVYGKLERAQIESFNALPTGADAFLGRIIHLTVQDGANQVGFYEHDGSSWNKLLADPTTTKGDLIVQNGSLTTRLGVGADGQLLTANSAEATGLSWSTPVSAPSSESDITNLTFTATVATNALTISLKTQSGATPSGGDPLKISFRSATLTDGTYNQRLITSATDLVVPSGTTLGTASGVEAILYLYAMDNAGTVVLAISKTLFQDSSIQSSSAISGGSSSSTLYSTSAQTSLPIRLIGRIVVTEATAGVWATAPTELNLKSYSRHEPNDVISASTNTWSTVSTTEVDVTNLSVTITTSGRRLAICLVPAGSGASSRISVFKVTSNSTYGTIRILRDSSVEISEIDIGGTVGSSTAVSIYYPPGVINGTDKPSAGTYTYKVTAKSSDGDQVNLNNCKLLVYEL